MHTEQHFQRWRSQSSSILIYFYILKIAPSYATGQSEDGRDYCVKHTGYSFLEQGKNENNKLLITKGKHISLESTWKHWASSASILSPIHNEYFHYLVAIRATVTQEPMFQGQRGFEQTRQK